MALSAEKQTTTTTTKKTGSLLSCDFAAFKLARFDPIMHLYFIPFSLNSTFISTLSFAYTYIHTAIYTYNQSYIHISIKTY